MTEERWDATMQLNLKPGFHLVQLLAPDMLENDYKFYQVDEYAELEGEENMMQEIYQNILMKNLKIICFRK